MPESDRLHSKKIYAQSDSSKVSGINMNTGPYIGVVKNNFDILRSGRLQVYIPFMGGPDPNDKKYWTTCCYASPFFGHANLESTKTTEGYDQVKQSYGFWMVPPDIGVRVLVIFANGDPDLAYWFACIPEPYVHHMVPGIGSRDSSKINLDNTSPAVKTIINARGSTSVKYPTSEIDARKIAVTGGLGPGQNAVDLARFYSDPTKRLVHEDVYKQLLTQGLDIDPIRGAISTSSQRETPSNVFGFSSPGRPNNDIAGLPDSEQVIASDKDLAQYLTEGQTGRRGGHSLVFDDGDVVGRDMLVRLRTARGHQILMHDTEDLIYISSANGQTWVELSADGQVQIYGANSISLRTQRDFNLHADGNVNINAGGSLNLYSKVNTYVETGNAKVRANGSLNMYSVGELTAKADGTLGIQSSGALGITSSAALDIKGSKIGLNSAAGPAGVTVDAITKNNHPDSLLANGFYNNNSTQVQSINPVVPTHEPWAGHPPAKSNSARADLINRLR